MKEHQTTHIGLAEIKGKKYEATIYRDAEDAHYDSNPEVYVIEKKIVDSKTILKLKAAAGGGYAISLKKL